MVQRYRAYDTVQIDASQIEDKGDYLLIKNVVACREIVQPYEDGKAYKPADELEKTYWTLDGRWAKYGNHPDSVLIMSINDVNGQTINPRFVKNLKDAKTKRPNGRGTLVDLKVFKDHISEKDLKDLAEGKKPNVSIGFTYDKDETPGEWGGDAYDYVQRNIFMDHLAFGTPKGRCPYPLCGIGADTVILYEGLDPEETENYIHVPVVDKKEFVQGSFKTIDISASKGIKAIIGKLKSDPEGSTVVQKYLFLKEKGWTMEKAKTWVSEHKDGDVMSGKASDLTLAEINEKIVTLKEKRDGLRKEVSNLYLKRDEEWNTLREKQNEEWSIIAQKYDEQLQPVWDKLSELEEELAAYREAKITTLTREIADKADTETPIEKATRAQRHFTISLEKWTAIGDVGQGIFLEKLPGLQNDEKRAKILDNLTKILVGVDVTKATKIMEVLDLNLNLNGSDTTYTRETLRELRIVGVCFECLDNYGALDYDKAPEDTEWKYVESDYTIEQLRYASAVVSKPVEGKELTKGECHLPHHLPGDGKTHGGKLIWNGVKAAGGILEGARGGVEISDEDKTKARTHLQKHYHEFDKKAPWEEGDTQPKPKEGDKIVVEPEKAVDEVKRLNELIAGHS